MSPELVQEMPYDHIYYVDIQCVYTNVSSIQVCT